jgi:hypothetical protein
LIGGGKDVTLWKEKILGEESTINWGTAQKALQTFCLKPQETAEIFKFLLLVAPA